MPALANPRHEAYAQIFFAGLTEGRTQAQAYIEAGYKPKTDLNARTAASRLMSTIVNRVRELQDDAARRKNHKIDLSRERVGRNLDEASRIAQTQQNAQGIVAAELGIARVFGLATDTNGHNHVDYSTAQNMQDIGCKLLQSVGLASPSELDVAEAIALNDTMVAGLEAIRDRAQGTIEQG